MDEKGVGIACIGWGSLVWNPGNLPLRGEWQTDGPMLPVEYARESSGGRITLVICKNVLRVQTLWAIVEASDVHAARQQLGLREFPSASSDWIATEIGYWDRQASVSYGQEADAIGSWAAARGLAGAVWTSLGWGFRGKTRRGVMPSLEAVVAHLDALQGKARADAEEYVRRTPAQIDTIYRRAIVSRLGWVLSGS